MKQKGQVIIVLLLVMLVSLAIGVSIVQNSVTEISISTKTDQSTSALSAAEAGIEKALVSSGSATLSVDFLAANQSKADVTISPDLPDTPGQGLQYDSVSKSDFAHFWLANPTTIPPSAYYIQPTFTLYFGNCEGGTCSASNPAERPAVEVDVVTQNSSGVYQSVKYYYDSYNNIASNRPAIGFTYLDSSNCNSSNYADTTSGLNKQFYCKIQISSGYSALITPILVRVRLLYSTSPQRIDLNPAGLTSLPKQAKIYQSTGTSGQTQRIIKVFKENDVVPYFLDFAIYSEGVLSK